MLDLGSTLDARFFGLGSMLDARFLMVLEMPAVTLGLRLRTYAPRDTVSNTFYNICADQAGANA